MAQEVETTQTELAIKPLLLVVLVFLAAVVGVLQLQALPTMQLLAQVAEV
jgi:hypothetical protein